MLVLSRRVGERVVIESNICVTVLAVEGRRISLGIEAPPSVPIVRSELVEPRRAARRRCRPRPARTRPARLALYG